MRQEKLIKDWKELMFSAVNKLNAFNNHSASVKPKPDKWSQKEILGHLCDSAINNYSRVIRIQLSNEVYSMERYAQNDWVRLGGYQNKDWEDVINQWLVLNNAFIILVENTPEHCFDMTADYDGQQLTLDFIVSDYVEHMKHHLNQILSSGI